MIGSICYKFSCSSICWRIKTTNSKSKSCPNHKSNSASLNDYWNWVLRKYIIFVNKVETLQLEQHQKQLMMQLLNSFCFFSWVSISFICPFKVCIHPEKYITNFTKQFSYPIHLNHLSIQTQLYINSVNTTPGNF